MVCYHSTKYEFATLGCRVNEFDDDDKLFVWSSLWRTKCLHSYSIVVGRTGEELDSLAVSVLRRAIADVKQQNKKNIISSSSVLRKAR
jgi:hypothetical protein